MSSSPKQGNHSSSMTQQGMLSNNPGTNSNLSPDFNMGKEESKRGQNSNLGSNSNIGPHFRKTVEVSWRVWHLWPFCFLQLRWPIESTCSQTCYFMQWYIMWEYSVFKWAPVLHVSHDTCCFKALDTLVITQNCYIKNLLGNEQRRAIDNTKLWETTASEVT